MVAVKILLLLVLTISTVSAVVPFPPGLGCCLNNRCAPDKDCPGNVCTCYINRHGDCKDQLCPP